MAEHPDPTSGPALSKEELTAKLTGKPDFVMEECYCKGVGEYCIDNAFCVQLAATATLPTRYGVFTLYGFYDNREGKEHTAIVHGTVEGLKAFPSACTPSATRATSGAPCAATAATSWRPPCATSPVSPAAS